MSHTKSTPLIKKKIDYFSRKLGVKLSIIPYAVKGKSDGDIYTYLLYVVSGDKSYDFEYEEKYLINVSFEEFKLNMKFKIPFLFDNEFITNQQEPTKGKTKILDLVLSDLTERAEAGKIKYGTYLESHNGRDALIDAYQEALDLCMYLRQAIEEREGC